MNCVSKSQTIVNRCVKNHVVMGKAWYGIAGDIVLDSSDSRMDPDEERKGNKYDEVADVRNLLDQFMVTTAADKSLSSIKFGPKMDELGRLDGPDLGTVITFFRTRSLPIEIPLPPPPMPERLNLVQQAANNQERLAMQSRSIDRFSCMKTKETTSTPDPSVKTGERKKRKPGDESLCEYKAKILAKKAHGTTLLQQLAKQAKEKEERGPQPKPCKTPKWHDGADYP